VARSALVSAGWDSMLSTDGAAATLGALSAAKSAVGEVEFGGVGAG